MNRNLAILSMLILAIAGIGLKSGDLAPDFAVKNQDGKVVHLHDFEGKPVLMYFYPKDETPGCTKEACSFRDEFSKFKKLGAVVLGVSMQDEKSHQGFRSKHKIPFDLLVDQDGSLAKAYGVGFLAGVPLHKRQSILISAGGKVLKFYDNVDPKTHTNEVLKDLESLKK